MNNIPDLGHFGYVASTQKESGISLWIIVIGAGLISLLLYYISKLYSFRNSNSLITSEKEVVRVPLENLTNEDAEGIYPYFFRKEN